MFGFLLELHPLYLLLGILAPIFAFFPLRKAYIDYRIRKLGGVRCPIIATNPIAGE